MNPQDANIELRVQGRGQRVVVLAVLDGEAEKPLGRGDIADPKHRAKLAKALCDEFPAVQIESARNAIDEMASRHFKSTQPARPNPSSSTDDDQGDGPASTLTDTCNAERLVRAHGEKLRYCHPWKKWVVWDGKRWREDDRSRVMGLSKRVVRALQKDALAIEDPDKRRKTLEWGIKSETSERRKAMVDLARSEPGIPVTPDELNRDPWLLNCQNATIDLRTGELRAHKQSDLITKVCSTNLDLAASCPRWLACLQRVLPDDRIRSYFQRFCGYCLTGEVSEQMILIATGDGANGKSTVFRVLQEVLSTCYAIQICADLLTSKSQRGHPTEVADLFGIRLAVGIETSKHQELDVPLIKQLTGGDRLRARRMREDFWEFDPTHKIVLVTNHLPRVPVDDYAMLRRLHRLPFEVTIPIEERDKNLLSDLQRERDGVLAWMVEGCRAWLERGLDPPEELWFPTPTVAPHPVDEFISQRVVRRPGARTKASVLYRDFQAWCLTRECAVVTQTDFGTRMGRVGIGRHKSGGVVVYLDAELKAELDRVRGGLGTVGDHFQVQPPTASRESTNTKLVPDHPQLSPDPVGAPEFADESEKVDAPPGAELEADDDGLIGGWR